MTDRIYATPHPEDYFTLHAQVLPYTGSVEYVRLTPELEALIEAAQEMTPERKIVDHYVTRLIGKAIAFANTT